MSSSHEERIRFFVPSTGIDGPEEISAEDIGFSLSEGRLLHISSSVDMENPVSIGCAGAVLTHLQRRRATATSIGPLDDCPFRVRYLEMFSLRDSM
jgi:DNA mismatch repair protein MSH5